MVLISIEGLLCGLVITWLFELVLKTNKKLREKYYTRHNIFFGYHIHHSTYSFLPLIWSVILFLQNQKSPALFAVWFAVGIIIMHTISDRRFVFIEKQKL
ncbi:MAG: hypothetical protein Q7S77_01025 [Candidatus Staskawiczbacteria bacterium]|nr:hypothetical protein [Candidatus Staskawiczbacteria bacterium]